jgi:hypothetical protein
LEVVELPKSLMDQDYHLPSEVELPEPAEAVASAALVTATEVLKEHADLDRVGE